LDSPTNASGGDIYSTPTCQGLQKYKGIVFTDKDGNIIHDNNDPEQYDNGLEQEQYGNGLEQENIEITGVSDVDDDDLQNITEMYQDNSMAENITGVYDENQENQDITKLNKRDRIGWRGNTRKPRRLRTNRI
jgi:hypothetical protein